ncbi:tyrosine-type recombinase/integrase [Thermodesulfobacteriota bacterium]
MNKSFSDWADRPTIEITRDKVLERFRELTEKSPAQANQAFRVLRAILNYAMATLRPDDKPLIIENPVRVLSDAKMWNHIKPRSSRIPNEKVGDAWNVLQEIRNNDFETVIRHTLADAISILLLSGARWSEMASLTWDDVNLDEGWWYLPDPKNRKPTTFPLSKKALEILKERKRQDQKGKWVFPARSGEGHIHDARGLFMKLSDAVGVHVTAHDLRRTFRAIAGQCNLELWKAKLLMNHRLSQDVTIGHYTETEDLRYLADEINMIGDWIVRQGIIASNEKVMPFPLKAINEGGEA